MKVGNEGVWSDEEEGCPYARLCFFKYWFVASHATTNNPLGLHSEILAAGLCSSFFNCRRLPDWIAFWSCTTYVPASRIQYSNVFAQKSIKTKGNKSEELKVIYIPGYLYFLLFGNAIALYQDEPTCSTCNIVIIQLQVDLSQSNKTKLGIFRS